MNKEQINFQKAAMQEGLNAFNKMRNCFMKTNLDQNQNPECRKCIYLWLCKIVAWNCYEFGVYLVNEKMKKEKLH